MRSVIFGAFLREEVVEPVGHAQWVFTIPKIVRGYFLRNRELLGDLSRVAWETVRALMAEAAGDPGVRPGMVVVPQTFGSSVNAHPHVHAIASRGGWRNDGTWVPIPYVDSGAAMRIIAIITERSVITKILAYLAKAAAAIATEGAGPGPFRSPPPGPAPAPSVN